MRAYDVNENIAQLDPSITPLSNLAGTIQMIRTIDGIFARGSLHCSAEFVCSRCLADFAMPLRITLEEEYRTTVDLVSGANLPVLAADEAATLIDEHHTLDLSEVLRQDLLLAIPPNPICRINCAGLCPTCGNNRNDEKCDHADENIDPRLEVLKELLKEGK